MSQHDYTHPPFFRQQDRAWGPEALDYVSLADLADLIDEGTLHQLERECRLVGLDGWTCLDEYMLADLAGEAGQ
jgi:hypothetical protein